MQRVSNDEIVNNDRSNNCRINQFDSWKASFSRERDQSWKNQDLCEYFLLYASKMRISFQLVVNLHTQDAYVIKWLLYDITDFYRRLHVEFRNVFRQMYQFVFNRRKNDFVTTISQQTMFVHFLQQSTVVDRINVVNENVDVVHKIDDNHLSQAAIQKQDCGITWCDYSHVMWLRWLCIERNNSDSSIFNIYRELLILE